MKVLEKFKMAPGGGYSTYKALLLVMAVLGLVSLIGCDNGNSGDSSNGNPEVVGGGSAGGTTSSDVFAGTWTASDGKTLTFTPGKGLGNGEVTGTLLPSGKSCYYLVSGSIYYAIIKETTGSQSRVATVTYNQSSGNLSYVKETIPVTLTKQQ